MIEQNNNLKFALFGNEGLNNCAAAAAYTRENCGFYIFLFTYLVNTVNYLVAFVSSYVICTVIISVIHKSSVMIII